MSLLILVTRQCYKNFYYKEKFDVDHFPHESDSHETAYFFLPGFMSVDVVFNRGLNGVIALTVDG